DRTYLHSLQGDAGTLRISVNGPQYEALSLVEPNGYAGHVILEEGVLRGTSASIPSQVHTETIYATLSFDQDFTGEYTGTISGTGTIQKRGTGMLQLTGSNTFTESLRLEEGVV